MSDLDVVRIARFELENAIEQIINSASIVELNDNYEEAKEILISLKHSVGARINS